MLVVALPAAALIVLGVRLLEQDRTLAVQRRGELAQQAADRPVRALEQQVALVLQRLGEPQWVPAAAVPPGPRGRAEGCAASEATGGSVACQPDILPDRRADGAGNLPRLRRDSVEKRSIFR